MRKVLEMTFAGEDFRVISAESADAGFAKLRSERPSIVLCDVTLDGPGGYAICAKIKSENPTVAVVLMASKQQPYDAHKGQSARADDFIEKPFDTQQLIDKVKRLATRPVDAAAAARPAAPAGPPMSVGPATQPGVAPAPVRPPDAHPRSRGAGSRAGGQPAAHKIDPPCRAPAGVGRGTLAHGAYARRSGPLRRRRRHLPLRRLPLVHRRPASFAGGHGAAPSPRPPRRCRRGEHAATPDAWNVAGDGVALASVAPPLP
jgi:CheY-like chemotaxis protein